jgi:DNA polymerase III subunit epsilon
MRVSTFQAPIVFVDIETNGLSHVRGRVIEVAAIRVENGAITREFHSLIDPGIELPPYITRLTGITSGDLAGAPTFDQIADELQDILQDAIFVAHNVRFDYSFLKQEFGRLNTKFLPKQLCTVKLSRALHPHERGHKLEDLINRHGFKVSQRHRARDDATVLWQFIQYLAKHFPPEQIEAAIAKQIRQPSIPKGLESEIVRNLPDSSGVYIFEDSLGQPIYIGKSINIRKRVLSHFSRDHAESKEFKIAQSIKHVRTQQTPGELSALLLESKLVKELQPIYNRQLRRKQKLLLLRESFNSSGHSTLRLEEANSIDADNITDILAVYTHRGKARQSLESAAKMYDLCPKLMGMEKARGACFQYQLKKCRGACIDKEPAGPYNQRLQLAFDRQRIQSWPYQGAVLIQETTANQPHAIIVDQWCVLGEMTQEQDCEPVVTTEAKQFDLDTYKILESFISTKLNKLSIKPLQRDQLQALLNA